MVESSSKSKAIISDEDSKSRDGSSRQSKDGSIRLQKSKLTQFFAKKQNEQGKKPLAPHKQRAIPIIKQARPRVIISSQEEEEVDEDADCEMTTTTASKTGSVTKTGENTNGEDNEATVTMTATDEDSPEEKKAGSRREAIAAATREDAVDLSLKDYTDEVLKDAATNPVEQANKLQKRQRVGEDQGAFLATDPSLSSAGGANSTFQDEQIALYRAEMAEQNSRSDSSRLMLESSTLYGADAAANEALEDIEQASDDDDVADLGDETDSGLSSALLQRGRRRGRKLDSEYNEDPIQNAEDDSEEAPLDELEPENIMDAEEEALRRQKKKTEKVTSRRHRTDVDEANLIGDEQEETVFIDNLPNDEQGIKSMLAEVKRNIMTLEKQFLMEEDSDAEEDEKLLNELQFDANIQVDDEQKVVSYVDKRQFWCVPILTDVMTFDFQKLGRSQMQHAGRLFDIVCMDPPWQLSTANPTRGVAIAYTTLTDEKIKHLPLEQIQSDGFLFIWVINNKYRFALDMMKIHGYKLVDEIVWVKQTINGKINKGHGYYLQHAKETCLVGYKGDLGDRIKGSIDCDVIFSMRRGQSQKPEEIYDICESLVPQGYYLEIFGRRNNLHDGWCTIGNEL